MAYRIQLPQFEGPLELLLSLIEKQKLDVTRVSLAKITDQYLEFIAQENKVSLQNLAQFLVIASRLILIKSRALLPLLSFSDEEEEEIEDLEFRLREYKKFKDVSLKLKGLFDLKRVMVSRDGYAGFESIFYPPQGIGSAELKLHFLNVLSEIPVFEKLDEEAVEEVVTIEEKIISLQETLRRRVQTSFSDIMAQSKDKVDVIVSFLAMLELVKQRIIHAEQQEGLFSEIRLKHVEKIQKI